MSYQDYLNNNPYITNSNYTYLHYLRFLKLTKYKHF